MGPQTTTSPGRLRSFSRSFQNGLCNTRVLFFVVLGLLSGLITPAYAATFSESWTSCTSIVHNYDEPVNGRYAACEINTSNSTVNLNTRWSSDNSYYSHITHWYYTFSGTCTAGSVSYVTFSGTYSSVSDTPTYSNAFGTPCQCAFEPRAFFDSPPAVTGRCIQTGRLYGDYASDPAPPVSPPVSDSVEPTCLAQACLDIVKAKYCATDSSGTQVCTDAIGDDGATPKNCAIGDGIAVCAGTPDAPLPNWTPVPDPLQDQSIKLVDNDGNVVNSQLTFYDTTGQGNNSDPGDGATTSGSTGNGGNNGSQGSADQNGKCSDGSTPSAGGCAAGYTDNGCDAPPTCSGDPLLCAQLRETHAQRCASAKARADAATARSSDAAYLDGVAADGDGPEHSPGDAWVSGQVGTGTSVDVNDGGTGDASSKLEIKRYWGSRHECPGAPEVPVPGLTEAMTYSMCKGGSYLAAFILAMGYVFGTLAFAATVSGD